jgi:hypothetical protein
MFINSLKVLELRLIPGPKTFGEFVKFVILIQFHIFGENIAKPLRKPIFPIP